MNKIEVRDLYKIFGRRSEQVLERVRTGLSKEDALQETGHTVGLNAVSLDIKPGETFVVMGLSGSGKSTLIRCLNRLIEPTAGQILIDGQDITGLGRRDLGQVRREKMGMVFQHFALLPHRNIIDNVSYGLKVQGVKKPERYERAQHWIDVVGLTGYEQSRPTALSGGMQQRVGLARALATDPEILLMDEAFSALDPLIRREMQDELIRLQKQLNKTIVFITHDLDEALRLGDRVAILKDGEVVQVGTPEDILLEPADEYVHAFVKDVDRSRVLTAAAAMEKPVAVQADMAAADLLEQMQQESSDFMFITDAAGHYRGVVTLAAAEAGADRRLTDLSELMSDEVETARSSRSLKSLLRIGAVNELPLAIVDSDGLLKGVLSDHALLEALAGQDSETAVNGNGSRESGPAATPAA